MTDQALDELFKTWGRCKRKVLGVPPPPRSIMGRIADEGPGASIRGPPPAPPEVMLGDGLAVAVAIILSIEDGSLKLDAHEALFTHYVTYGPDHVKARRINRWIGEYHRLLDEGRSAVAPHVWAVLDRPLTP